MNTLLDPHALVCGASAGIGRATAFALAAMGARVTVLARRADRLEALVPKLIEAGAPKARALVVDLDDRPRAFAAVEALVGEAGAVHILLNNTGGPPAGPLIGAGEDELLRAFGRHVLVAQGLLQRVLPGMEAAGFGRVINVLSTSVREPIPNLGVSNIILAAMASWSKSLAQELPPGITINNVLPGYTDTERLDALGAGAAARTGQSVEEVRRGWLKVIPEGRLGRADEVAALIAFLASPSGAYVRGQSIAVDGGRTRGI